MWGGLTQPAEDLNTTKRRRKGPHSLSLSLSLSADTSIFSCPGTPALLIRSFRFGLNHKAALLGLQPADSRQHKGLLCNHNCINQISTINFSAHGPFHIDVCVCVSCSVMSVFATPWTVAHQAPLSMQEFSRQEYWSRVPFSPPRGPSNHGIKPTSAALAGRFFTTEPPGKPPAVTTSHLLYTILTQKSAFILGQFW